MMQLRTSVWLIATAIACSSVHASLTMLSGPQQGTHFGNLVTNGSFENGSPGPGSANFRYWATGTTLTPFAIPPGWSSSGQPSTYAVWGSDSPGAPYRVRASDDLPDGVVGMYFGNGGGVQTNLPPNFNVVNGKVTFPGAPTFAVPFGGPVHLTQTVNTHLNPAPSYIVSFWVSGEGSSGAGHPTMDGIVGFKITNVLPGDPIQYLTSPSGSSSPLGGSHRYEYSFVPLNPSLPVTLEFTNWGHFDLSAYGRAPFTTEVVLDDVIVNTVPEPASLSLLIIAPALLRRAKREV